MYDCVDARAGVSDASAGDALSYGHVVDGTADYATLSAPQTVAGDEHTLQGDVQTGDRPYGLMPTTTAEEIYVE
jgi:hypothetical protein